MAPRSDPASSRCARFEDEVVAEIPRLRSWLRRLAGDEAEDVLQDAMERALRYRHAFDGRRPVRGWLSRTAFRAFLDRRARSGREPEELGERAAELAAAPSARGADSGATRAELELLLAGLSARERDILIRFHARDESVVAIAAALDMPAGTVKSHLHRARRKLAARRPEASS